MPDSPLASVAKAVRGGAFFLHGEDEFRKEEAARMLVQAHLDPSTRDFNFDRLRGATVDAERLASVLATPPLMAEWRVVLLTETEALTSSARAREALLGALASLPPGLALILVATIPDRSRARFYKDLEARARSWHFPAVSPNDVPDWLMARGEATHGVQVDPDAARALAAAVGSDLGVLAQELEKLVSFAGERRRITRGDVEAAGTRIPRQDRWQWFDRVGERRFGEALTSLGTLLGQGETGVGLVAGLGTHLLRLAVAAEGGPAALTSVLEQSQPWLAKRLLPQARRWRTDELQAALLGLLKVDQLLKASGLSEEALLEEWLLAQMVAAETAA